MAFISNHQGLPSNKWHAFMVKTSHKTSSFKLPTEYVIKTCLATCNSFPFLSHWSEYGRWCGTVSRFSLLTNWMEVTLVQLPPSMIKLRTFLWVVHDGGPSMGPHQEPQDTLGGSKFSSNIKEKAQALLHQLAALLRLNSTHKPGFVDLLEDDPDWVIFCTPHPHSA